MQGPSSTCHGPAAPTHLGPSWGGPWPLLHFDPVLRVKLGQAGRQALGERLQVAHLLRFGWHRGDRTRRARG